MEHPGGQPPTPCAPHASYAGMRACARCAGAPAAPPPLARGITQCGAPSRSVPRQGAKYGLPRTTEPPERLVCCDLRGTTAPSLVLPPSSRGTHPRPFSQRSAARAHPHGPRLCFRAHHPVARHTCAASCQARGGEPGTLRNGSLSTLCLEMPRSAGLLSLFEHQLPPRWRMIRSR